MIDRVAPTGGSRLLLYAHDTYGLGHLRRTLAIAGHMAQTQPDLSTLLLTGSSVAHQFAMPPRVDYVKLPSVVKTGDEQYRSRHLDVSADTVVSLRAAVIREAAIHFAPDVVLVDHAPLGMKGELLPALRHLRRMRPRARLVLGLRDILDEPEKVRRQWSEGGVYAAIDALYDRVLIYGQADMFDPVEAYAFPEPLARRTRFCGYIRREDPVRLPSDLRTELGLGDAPFVLVTTGGGGDGSLLEETFLAALSHVNQSRNVQAVVITGPLMPAEEQARLDERARGLPVRMLPFHPDVPGLMRASALVVAMGGYNTLCEVLTSGCPAVIVPRAYPRLEQHMRAAAFARRGLVELLPAADATPERLARVIEQGLDHGGPSAATRARWDGDGLSSIGREIGQLLDGRTRVRETAAV